MANDDFAIVAVEKALSRACMLSSAICSAQKSVPDIAQAEALDECLEKADRLMECLLKIFNEEKSRKNGQAT